VVRDVVAAEKYEASAEGQAFVAIDEWVIAAEIKQIGGGNFYWIGNERLAECGGLGRSDRGFEQAAIAQALAASVRPQGGGMNGLRRRDR